MQYKYHLGNCIILLQLNMKGMRYKVKVYYINSYSF